MLAPQRAELLRERARDDVEATAQALWATIHGLTSLLIAHPKFQWVERNHLIDTLVDNAMKGLGAGRPVLVE